MPNENCAKCGTPKIQGAECSNCAKESGGGKPPQNK